MTDLDDVLMPDILHVPDMAKWLRMPESQILRLLEDGELPGRRLWGQWLVEREALLDLLRSPGSHVRPPPPEKRNEDSGDLHVLRDEENEDE